MPLKRSPMKRRTRLNPVSKKRRAARPAWERVKRQVWARDHGICAVPWCARRAEDAHHIRKRSQGGTDVMENLVALDRRCHDATDLPKGGRLLIMVQDNITGIYYRFLFSDPTHPVQAGPWHDKELL